MFLSYILLYPLSTAIILIFELHLFNPEIFFAYLLKNSHIYTGFLFMGIGAVIGLIITHFLTKQDLLNTELMEINNALYQSNLALRNAVNSEDSDSFVFLDSIRPTINKINQALNEVDDYSESNPGKKKQIELTKRNVKQIADLIDLITESKPPSDKKKPPE